MKDEQVEKYDSVPALSLGIVKGTLHMGFPSGASGKEPACQCMRQKRCGFNPWVSKIPWRRTWPPSPVLLPGESHGWRSLVGYTPWGCKDILDKIIRY